MFLFKLESLILLFNFGGVVDWGDNDAPCIEVADEVEICLDGKWSVLDVLVVDCVCDKEVVLGLLLKVVGFIVELFCDWILLNGNMGPPP